ncbi:DUF445 domain-containing protein [Zhongshania arctica]|uniref:DUF445 domain-containing protein n=1 Tax=Zhongshania arctica TaxID=3238302 RepID=A0ABV3TUJ3_9GAMM
MSWNELIPYLVIAPMTAGVGWLTNLLGIKMMFYPVNFVGVGRYFGWQGIIPRLRIRLTRNLVNISIAKICSPKEVVMALDDGDAIENIQQLISPYIDDWIEDVLVEQNVQAWQYTPERVKKMVFARVQDKLPGVAQAILAEFADRADQLVDFAQLAENQVRDKPELLNELFLRCAGSELRFVIRSGLMFGFPLGCVQALIWYFYPYTWVLPVFGVFVGAGTNWIALKMIAHPADPVMVGPFKLQGLYLRRQPVVSQEFAEIFTSSFMSPKAFMDYLWLGPKSMEVHRIVHRHVRKALDKNMLGKIAAQMAVTTDGFEKLKKTSVEYTADRIMETIDNPEANRKLALPIVDLIARRMSALKPKEFQQLLLPAFEQDQMLIVLLGGVLGGLVGFAQLIWLFGVSI